MFDFCIIGGGASGMYASILLAKKGYSVALLEANSRVGKRKMQPWECGYERGVLQYFACG